MYKFAENERKNLVRDCFKLQNEVFFCKLCIWNFLLFHLVDL